MFAHLSPLLFLRARVPPSLLPKLLVLALAGCAVPPCPPSAPVSRTNPRRPTTYRISFVYEPSFSLLLWRNGTLYTGPATLSALLPEGHESTAIAFPFRFTAGKASIPPDWLGRLRIASGFHLRLDGRDLSLLSSEEINPFWCAWSLHLLGKTDPSRNHIPPAALPPEHCDAEGKRAWLRLRENEQKRFRKFWATLDEPTLKQFASVEEEKVGAICEVLVEALGPNPPSEQALRIVPRCLEWFPTEDRTRIGTIYARQQLQTEFNKARQGADSEEMRRFHERYCEIDPKKAREIRLLATQKFGPPNLGAWLKLRQFIENLSIRSPSLCHVDGLTVEISYGFRGNPHGVQGIIDELNEKRHIKEAIERRTHKRVEEMKSCRVDHWYLTIPKAAPRSRC